MRFSGAMVLCLGMAFAVWGQSESRPWEKYGLSQTEWKLIQENKLSKDKVRMLLSAGIAISEYCQRPWEKVALTESEWIEKRRAGLTSYDIELEVQSNRRRWKVDTNAATSISLYSSYSRGSNQFISFALPGFQQLRLNQTTRGSIMAGLAFASLAGCLAGAVIEDRFEARPLYFVLAPDMLWSFIDYKITLGRMKGKTR